MLKHPKKWRIPGKLLSKNQEYLSLKKKKSTKFESKDSFMFGLDDKKKVFPLFWFHRVFAGCMQEDRPCTASFFCLCLLPRTTTSTVPTLCARKGKNMHVSARAHARNSADFCASSLGTLTATCISTWSWFGTSSSGTKVQSQGPAIQKIVQGRPAYRLCLKIRLRFKAANRLA